MAISACTSLPLDRVETRAYTLILRVTERCLVGCDHCCIEAHAGGTDIPDATVELAIRNAKAAGVGLIHFTGGEPLLHRNLIDYVRVAAHEGLYAELTTSTFTTGDENTEDLLPALRDAGLMRVMLSYDAAHSRRVSIGKYADFMRQAQKQDLEICALIVEWPGTAWTLRRVRNECEAQGVDGSRVEWCRTDLSMIGRARERYVTFDGGPAEHRRCPYVLTAPTLAPDGTVYLCPNAKSQSKLFQIGNVNDRPLDDILSDMQSSAFYRALSALGPTAAAIAIGLPLERISSDMCNCCQTVLAYAEDPNCYARLEDAGPPAGVSIPLEIEGLLPAHRRFVLGEERPAVGCECG